MEFITKAIIRRAVSNKHMPFSQLMVWEPWKGCTPVSEACLNCYYNFSADQELIENELDIKIFPEGKIIITSFMSDFFHPQADKWRFEAWRIIKRNPGSQFLLLTKRPERVGVELPLPIEAFNSNIIFGVTVENQRQADIRLPILQELKVSNKYISCSPLLERIDIKKYLDSVSYVSVAGEVAKKGRQIDFDWVKDLKAQCVEKG